MAISTETQIQKRAQFLNDVKQRLDKNMPVRLDVTIGYDGGNSDTNVWGIFPDGTQHHIAIPSVIGTGNLERLQDLRSGVQRSLGKQQNANSLVELSVLFNNIEYFVGALAREQDNTATAGLGDELRYYGDDALIRCIAASHVIIELYEEEILAWMQEYNIPLPDLDNKTDEDTPKARALFDDIHLSIVSSVPVKWYTKEMRKAIKKAFTGSHFASVNGKDRFYAFTMKQVIMEGGAVHILAAEDQKEGNQDDSQPIVVIDGGGYTVDLIKLVDMQPVAKQCDSLDAGVEAILDLVSEQLRREQGRTLTLRERHQILGAYKSRLDFPTIRELWKAYPSFPFDDQVIEGNVVHGWVDGACKAVAKRIVGKASALWGTYQPRGSKSKRIAGDVPRGRAFFVGGEAYYLRHLIQDYMPHLIVPDSPEFANARANALICQALVEGEKE